MTELDDVKALAFDTGGTLVDWHGGIRDALADAAGRHGLDADFGAATNQWRRSALACLKQRRPAGAVRPNADEVHRRTLGPVLSDFGLGRIGAAEREELVQRWHRLQAWPDVAEGLAALAGRYTLLPLTILSVPMVVDLSRHAGLRWDLVVSCEMLGVYKPDPQAYLTAARWLGHDPAEVMMVACHGADLRAAAAVGFRTAFVSRPHEWGPGHAAMLGTDVDVAVTDTIALATSLGRRTGVGA